MSSKTTLDFIDRNHRDVYIGPSKQDGRYYTGLRVSELSVCVFSLSFFPMYINSV